jgi:DNA end-binding protein Ku
VPWGEIAKGYEYAKGQFVVITDEDLAKARVEATQAIDVRDFVPAGEIPWTFFESAYYVEPAKPGFRAYALLREALKESGRVGIGSVVLRQREHLGALAPSGDVLVLAMMKFAQELRSPDELSLPRDVAVDPRELQLARQLIDSLAADWKPEQYRDNYADAIRQVIEQKVEGKEITAPERKPRAKVIDLMEALRRSIDERAAKKPTVKEAPARAEATARKRLVRAEPAAPRSTKKARSA